VFAPPRNTEGKGGVVFGGEKGKGEGEGKGGGRKGEGRGGGGSPITRWIRATDRDPGGGGFTFNEGSDTGASIVASMGFVSHHVVPLGGEETEGVSFEGTPPRKPPPSLHSFGWQEAPRQPRAEGGWVGGGVGQRERGNGKGIKRDPSILGAGVDILDVSESESEGEEVHLPVLSRNLLPSPERYAYPRYLKEASEGQGGGQGRDKGGRGIPDGSSNEDGQMMALALESMQKHSS
jgi:hypothetical protein